MDSLQSIKATANFLPALGATGDPFLPHRARGHVLENEIRDLEGIRQPLLHGKSPRAGPDRGRCRPAVLSARQGRRGGSAWGQGATAPGNCKFGPATTLERHSWKFAAQTRPLSLVSLTGNCPYLPFDLSIPGRERPIHEHLSASITPGSLFPRPQPLHGGGSRPSCRQ